jgi:HK97 gp10 family phage protein
VIRVSAETSAVDRAADVLRSFPLKMQEKVLLVAAGGGAKLIRDEAARRAPVGRLTGQRGWKKSVKYRHTPGTMKRSLRVKVLSKSKGVVVLTVRPSGRKVFYWWFVEAGTRPHRIGRLVRTGTRFVANPRSTAGRGWNVPVSERTGRPHPGTRARWFLQGAADAKAPQVKELTARLLANAVDALARELSSR